MRANKILFLCVFLAIFTFTIATVLGQLDIQGKVYPVLMDGGSKVYDGDTIQDVYVDIADLKTSYPSEVLWPGVMRKDSDLFIVIDIRIAGIDTPEKRPRKAGRTLESRNREKAAAKKAQQELQQILSAHNKRITLENPKLGKYAGRIIAEVYVGEGKDRINVADHLIRKGHAIVYDGGTRTPFDTWYGK